MVEQEAVNFKVIGSNPIESAMDVSLEESYQYMLSRFDVKVEKDKFGKHDLYSIYVTHNGVQWELVNIYSPDEARKIIEVLQKIADA